MRVIPITLGLVMAAAPLAAQQDTTMQQQAMQPAAVTVAEIAIGRSVMDRVPQDTGSAFPADVGELVCWTRITGAEGETPVHHVWFRGDQEVANVELSVRGSNWRTWSRKAVPADWTGAWHVEVRDAAGNVLRRVDFTVGQ